MNFIVTSQATDAKAPEKTNREYCIYHPAHKDYTYNDKWIELLVGELNGTSASGDSQTANASS
jgi:hypothetical protein